MYLRASFHNRTVFILVHLSKFADALKISTLSVIKEDLRTKHYYLGATGLRRG